MKTALALLWRVCFTGIATTTAFVLPMNESMWAGSLVLRQRKHLVTSLHAQRRSYQSQLYWQFSEISENLQLAVVAALFAVSPSWDLLRARTAKADTNRAGFFVVL